MRDEGRIIVDGFLMSSKEIIHVSHTASAHVSAKMIRGVPLEGSTPNIGFVATKGYLTFTPTKEAQEPCRELFDLDSANNKRRRLTVILDGDTRTSAFEGWGILGNEAPKIWFPYNIVRDVKDHELRQIKPWNFGVVEDEQGASSMMLDAPMPCVVCGRPTIVVDEYGNPNHPTCKAWGEDLANA